MDLVILNLLTNKRPVTDGFTGEFVHLQNAQPQFRAGGKSITNLLYYINDTLVPKLGEKNPKRIKSQDNIHLVIDRKMFSNY